MIDSAALALAEVFEIHLPLVRPFVAAHGTLAERHAILVRLEDRRGIEGWGECGADITPYSAPESPDSCWNDLVQRLLPAMLEDRTLATGGGPMARATVAAALADLRARRSQEPLAAHWGGSLRPVPVGAVLGVEQDPGGLLAEAAGYVEQGYRRLKVKIQPGWDLEPLGLLRAHWPDVPLAADANASYSIEDGTHLAGLDRFDLDFLEQPFAPSDLESHARLARRSTTPICLDESIRSVADAGRAIEAGAAQLIAIKSARLGGPSEAIAVHDACVAAGVRPWVGGLLETGIGRAHAVALATLPGFREPADLSGSDRYFAEDIVTPPWTIDDGRLLPRAEAGIGCTVDIDRLERHLVRRKSLFRL